MKIAFDYQTFTQQSYGGVSRYFVRLAAQLAQQGETVRIFAPVHRNRYVGDLPKGLLLGREVQSFPPRTTRLISSWNRLTSMHAIDSWKPDILHETHYAARPSGRARHARVVTLHDMIHERYPDSFSRLDNTASLKKAALSRADQIICISENTKRDVMELLGIAESKITVVHHGFDAFANAAGATARAPGRPYLLYVGSRGTYKNFATLVEAIAASPRLKADYDLIAFGGGEFSREERQQFTALGLRPDQIRQQGGTDQVLGELYRHARAFVYPSLYEGFGLPPLEAMAHRCPVISSHSSSMPEIIGDAAAFFSPTDRDDMRETLERTLYDDQALQVLMDKGTARLTQFSWAKCARQTELAYRKAAG